MKRSTTLAIIVCLLLSVQGLGQNLITNGDFEAGNTGFVSNYVYVAPPLNPASSLWPEGTFTVYTNPQAGHSLFASFGDHTSTTGNMLIVNGATSAVRVWQQNGLVVTPHTWYKFSFWLASCVETSPAEIETRIRGRVGGVWDPWQALGSDVASTTPGEWNQVVYCWNSGEYTRVRIRLTDLNTDAGGNDFAIDDISFEECPWIDETGWAAGDPYNVDGKGNWATYTSYSGVEETVTLYAGQTMDAGTVTFSAPVGGEVTITIELNDGWRFVDLPENVKVQDYDTAPSGNPKPGQFDSKGYADPDDADPETFTIVVPQNNFYGVHVDVERTEPCCD